MISSKISCVIPTKNRKELANKAIKSVLDQTHSNVEVIVVDDGSMPPFELDQDDRFDRVKIIRNEISVGGAKARNMGLAQVTGDYFCFLDDDDSYLKDKFEVLLEVFKKDPKVEVAVGEIRMVNVATGLVSDNLERFDFERNVVRNRVHTNVTLIDSRLKGKIEFLESLEKFQDTQFNTELCYRFKVGYTEKVVAIWNLNWSNTQITKVRSRFRDTRNYFRLLRYFRRDLGIPYKYLYVHFVNFMKFLVRLR